MPNFKVTKRVVQEITYIAEVESPAKEIVEKQLIEEDDKMGWKISNQSNSTKISIRKCKEKE